IGSSTRRSIIEEYMALEGTTVPAEADVTVHGCGDTFPLASSTAKSPSHRDAIGPDRRVEVFLFERRIKPKPTAQISSTESKDNPAWLESVTEDVDVSTEAADDSGPLRSLLLADSPYLQRVMRNNGAFVRKSS